MPEGVQKHEKSHNFFYKVSWKGKAGVIELPRRTIESAMELAKAQRDRGFKTKLIRVEETEIEF